MKRPRAASAAPPPVAHRFVETTRGWFDLATGLRVQLAVGDRASMLTCEGDRRVLDHGTLDRGEAFVALTEAWARDGADDDPAGSLPAAGELLDAPRDEPMLIRLSGSRGVVRAGLQCLAREARLRGLVPVRAGLLSSLPEARRSVEGRTVLLLVYPPELERDRDAAVTDLAWLALRAQHVVGVLGALDTTSRATLQLALDHGGGARGDLERPARTCQRARAGAAAVADAERPAHPVARRTDRALHRGDRLVLRRRPGAAERAYRLAHAVARRRPDLAAWRGAAASRLARLLLQRGRPGAALAWCLDAVDALLASGGSSCAVEVAHLAGAALRRAGRPDAGARVQMLLCAWPGDAVQELDILTELVQCYTGQGRHDTALRAIDAVADRPGVFAPVLVTPRMKALLATGRLDEAGREASRLGSRQAGDGCESHAALAWFHAWVGDAGSLRDHVEAVLEGGAPLETAVDVRLAALHGARRLGAAALASTHSRALTRLRSRVEPLLQSQIDEALAGRPSVARVTGEQGGRVVLDEVLGVLQLGHEEDDSQRPLDALCRTLRRQLGSLSVAVFAGEALTRIADDGVYLPSATAAGRAFSTGVLVPFERVGHAVEAAAPIKRAGLPLGALACRWAADAALDLHRVSALLTAGAASSLLTLVERIEEARRPPEAGDHLGLIGGSPAMDRVRTLAARAAAAPFPVLIEGESGTGKELIARAIHRVGPRRSRRFCAVNCAALADDLLEAELFGHAKGAFTGAVGDRRGLFEEADGGTLFLDEVADLSARGQAKLLRVLQEGEVRRLGENLPRRVDVRLVAATNRPLRLEVAAGRYRDDLRYRLDVIRIQVPPLRERREDIPLLAAQFWADLTERAGRRARLDDAAVAALARHEWPGNVRELQNVLAALAVQAPMRGRVSAADLPEAIKGTQPGAPAVTLGEARRAFDREFVLNAIARTGGNRGAAARTLGLSRQGLAKLMARLEIDAADGGSATDRRLVVGRFRVDAGRGPRPGRAVG
jgi:DNA-binding NtrC family response regulator